MNSPETLIAIVDYQMGNLQSVRKAFEHLGIPVDVTDSEQAIASAAGVVLPGVGAFGDAMREMDARGITGVVRERALEASKGGRPFLGVCLGMQVLVDEGEEDPGIRGLGVVAGTCPRIRRANLKVPHMGWNSLIVKKQDNPLLTGLAKDSYVYFVHSYEVVPKESSVIAASCDYEGEIAAVLWKNNLFATQFHPEKSQACGLKMLENFGRIVRESRIVHQS